MKLKAFNLEEALKDVSKVRTRDGREVSEMYCFTSQEIKEPLHAIVCGQIRSYAKNGLWVAHKETDLDLFLIDETPVFETYHNASDTYVYGSWQTLKEAISARGYGSKKVIKLTISGDDVKAEIVHTY